MLKFPIWEFALDEEGVEGQDETWVRPVEAAKIPAKAYSQIVASTFIREYMMRNEQGIAPSHADLQRFFDLTPPSVNSMLIRLEQRGFIRRVPHQPRAIELIIDPEWIPPLDRPFRF